jgi:cytochrome c
MKHRILASMLIAFSTAVFISSQAVATPADADAATALAKRNGCFKCHAVDKAKKGPSYQKISAKYKGKPDGESQVIKNFTTGPKVKMDDGTEEEHKIIDTKNPKEIKNLANWILAQ